MPKLFNTASFDINVSSGGSVKTVAPGGSIRLSCREVSNLGDKIVYFKYDGVVEQSESTPSSSISELVNTLTKSEIDVLAESLFGLKLDARVKKSDMIESLVMYISENSDLTRAEKRVLNYMSRSSDESQ